MTNKSLIISEETHKQLKQYCDDNSIKMMKWVESVIIEKIKELNGTTEKVPK